MAKSRAVCFRWSYVGPAGEVSITTICRPVRNMKDLVIFGMGQIADVIHYYFTEEAGRRVVAFTVDSAYRTTEEHLGLPVVPFEELTASCPPDTHELFVAMSFRQVNKAREAKVREAETKGYTLASHV